MLCLGWKGDTTLIREISDIDNKIIDMAWCDKTSFDDIQNMTGVSEPQVISIMRKNLKASSFRLWRKRVTGRIAKHKKLKAQLHNEYSLV